MAGNTSYQSNLSFDNNQSYDRPHQVIPPSFMMQPPPPPPYHQVQQFQTVSMDNSPTSAKGQVLHSRHHGSNEGDSRYLNTLALTPSTFSGSAASTSLPTPELSFVQDVHAQNNHLRSLLCQLEPYILPLPEGQPVSGPVCPPVCPIRHMPPLVLGDSISDLGIIDRPSSKISVLLEDLPVPRPMAISPVQRGGVRILLHGHPAWYQWLDCYGSLSKDTLIPNT